MDDQTGFDTRDLTPLDRLLLCTAAVDLGRNRATDYVVTQAAARQFINVEDLELTAGAKGIESFLDALRELLGAGSPVVARFETLVTGMGATR